MTKDEALKLALEALEIVNREMLTLRDELAERGGRPSRGYHQLLWDSSHKVYTDTAIPAAEAIREALAQPEQEPVAIKWTLDGDKTCGYNNWLGKTPFGRILITWKGWKKYHDACVDEFPGDFHAYGLPDEVKELCEAEFAKRIGYTTPPQRTWQGLTLADKREFTQQDFGGSRLDAMDWAEQRLKEKNT